MEKVLKKGLYSLVMRKLSPPWFCIKKLSKRILKFVDIFCEQIITVNGRSTVYEHITKIKISDMVWCLSLSTFMLLIRYKNSQFKIDIYENYEFLYIHHFIKYLKLMFKLFYNYIFYNYILINHPLFHKWFYK